MKTSTRILAIFSAFIISASCQKDGEMLTVSLPGTDMDFSIDRTEIDLGTLSDTDLALTLMWNPDAVTPQISNPDVAMADDIVSLSFQMSVDEGFSSVYETSLDASAGVRQLTASEFSQMVLRLGISEQTVVYMRLAVSLSDNTGTSYSMSVAVTVIPLNVDMSVMTIVSNMSGNAGETIATIHSTDASPDVYEGFVVFSQGWYNFYACQADGTRWGNDGVAGTPYMISDDVETQWNCWSAEPSGCMYIYVDTGNRQWRQVYLPAVTVSGGATDTDMRFSTGGGSWTGTFTTTEANATVTFSGTGRQYDITTGTDAGVAPSEEIQFGLTLNADNTFTYSEGASGAGYTVAEAGTYTVTIDVLNGTWSVESGEPPVSYSEFYYAAYSWSDTNWDEAAASVLWSPDSDGMYTGYITTYTGSEWNTDPYRHFVFSPSEALNGGERLGAASPDDKYSLGALVSGGCLYMGDDPAAPGTGLYYVTLDLAGMTWTEEALDVYLMGTDGKWVFDDAHRMTYDPESGVYTQTVDITGEWGLEVVLDENYMHEYGGADGKLVAGTGHNFAAGVTGKYTVRVDLSNMSDLTYEMIEVQ